MMKAIMKYACNAVLGMCLGSFIDHFADTGCIFALIGIAVGIIASILIKSK